MSILNIIKPVADSVGGLFSTVFGDAGKKQVMDHEENTAAMQQYGAEFSRGPLTLFDSFVDGINRLQRPCITYSVLALFWFAYADTEGFVGLVQAFSLVPEPFWSLLTLIVGFLFTSRLIRSDVVHSIGKGIKAKVAGDIAKRAGDLFQAEDVAMPVVENKAIAEWRRTNDKS